MSEQGSQSPVTPEAFARMVSEGISSQSLSEEQLAAIRQVNQNIARDPALLRSIEQALSEGPEDLRRLAPSRAEFESFGWESPERVSAQVGSGGETEIAPVAAAAALAPPAAAMAAGPCSAE